MPVAANPVADDLVTASITGTGPDQVVRKEVLPAAVEPPPELGGDAVVEKVAAKPQKPPKVFTERVPEEEWASSERVEVSSASEPARAVEPVEAKPEEKAAEKIAPKAEEK